MDYLEKFLAEEEDYDIEELTEIGSNIVSFLEDKDEDEDEVDSDDFEDEDDVVEDIEESVMTLIGETTVTLEETLQEGVSEYEIEVIKEDLIYLTDDDDYELLVTGIYESSFEKDGYEALEEALELIDEGRIKNAGAFLSKYARKGGRGVKGAGGRVKSGVSRAVLASKAGAYKMVDKYRNMRNKMQGKSIARNQKKLTGTRKKALSSKARARIEKRITTKQGRIDKRQGKRDASNAKFGDLQRRRQGASDSRTLNKNINFLRKAKKRADKGKSTGARYAERKVYNTSM